MPHHIRKIHPTFDYAVWRQDSQKRRLDFNCIYCSREFLSAVGIGQHEAQCKDNPDRLVRIPWNIGLTADTDVRVRELAIKQADSRKGRKRQPLTPAHKQKLSEFRKQFILDNPDKVPYLMNHSSKGPSYPEQYFIKCFHGSANIIVQHAVARYRLDFANVAEKLYLEVDGEQHYSTQRAVDRDVERTQVLANLGWIGCRIRWRDFVKMSTEDKVAEVEKIKTFLHLYFK
jgi:very-short-patch-repair endonuclease